MGIVHNVYMAPRSPPPTVSFVTVEGHGNETAVRLRPGPLCLKPPLLFSGGSGGHGNVKPARLAIDLKVSHLRKGVGVMETPTKSHTRSFSDPSIPFSERE